MSITVISIQEFIIYYSGIYRNILRSRWHTHLAWNESVLPADRVEVCFPVH